MLTARVPLALLLAGAVAPPLNSRDDPPQEPVCHQQLDGDEFACTAADFYFEGEVDNDHLGASVDGGRDWDGDGVPDYLCGGTSIYRNLDGLGNKGRVQLYLGPLEVKPPTGTLPENLQDRDIRIDGEDGGDSFGVSAKFIGDVNGDGREDFAVGAWNWSASATQQGAVYVVLGRDNPGGVLPGSYLAGQVGSGLGGAGITSKIIRGTNGDRLGWSIAPLGDVNDDGLDDFAVGAPGDGNADPQDPFVHRGKLHLFYGDSSYWDSTPADVSITAVPAGIKLDPPLSGADDGDRFGFSVASVGDVDGNGLPDFLVGAPEYNAFEEPAEFEEVPDPNGIGYVRLYSGAQDPSELGQVTGPQDSGQMFGFSVTGMYSDLDGDGTLDVAVGAPGTDGGGLGSDDDAGAAYVLSGSHLSQGALATLESLFTEIGQGNDHAFGAFVAGDPRLLEECLAQCPKLAVSAPRFSLRDTVPNPPACCGAPRKWTIGKVSVYTGKNPMLTAAYTGEANRDRLGFGLAWVGDAGGSCVNDLMLSGFAFPSGTQVPSCGTLSEVGRVYLMLY